MLRVAAVQFATGTDVADNLATCLRMIDEAAVEGAQLVVLPEFCNHLSWYDDHDAAVRVALSLDDDFIRAMAAAAARHRIWLKWNATVHRGGGHITATNLLHDPSGRLAGVADKLVLMGGERLHMSEAEELGDVVDTPLGRLGLYSCMDGVICEPPRLLAVRGAQVLLNSLNSFALDEASLHIPVRAAENRVWVVAANKVGTLIPERNLDEVSRSLGVPAHMLRGAGESQVVAPDGSVVAIGPREGEAVVVADIDVARADDKQRPSGTDLFAARRPEIYRPLAAQGDGRAPRPGDEEVPVVAVSSTAEPVAAVASAVSAGARLVVLPELSLALDDIADVAAVAGDAHVVTSVRDGDRHDAVLIDRTGIVARQPQLHPSARHSWATHLGDTVAAVDLPWGRLALLCGEDVAFPESFRLAVLAGAEVVACATAALEPWEVSLGLVERAAENRVNIVAASTPTSVVVPLTHDFTLWTQWSSPFAGRISSPDPLTGDGVVAAVVRPAAAANKEISRATDLVAGRPWQLAGPLAEPVDVSA